MAKVWQPGSAGTLFKLFLKFNSDFGSLQATFHIKADDYAAAKVKATKIATRYKWVIPPSMDLMHAHISKDDSDSDSKQLPAVTGPGLSGSNKAVTPLVTKFNRYTDVLLVRFESDSGGAVTYKIGPIIDNFVVQQEVASAVTGFDGTAAPAEPATAAGIVYVDEATYASEMANLIQSIGANTIHLKSGHPPGGDYQYANWITAIPGVIGGKKGGRVLNSPHG